MTTPIREIAAGIPAAQSTPLSLTPTAQEVFDKVLNHLRTQGKAAMNHIGGSCMYRGEGSTSCALGCLIPDEMYSPAMEGGSAHAGRHAYPQLYDAIDALGLRAQLGLLERLQRAHDEVLQFEGAGAWERRMAEIATHHQLTYTPPTT